MTPQEAAALLACAAAFDNRKPDADAAMAWSVALDGLEFQACRDAIVEHHKSTKDWLMPSDVIVRVRRVRAKRIAEEAAVSPPPGMDPDRTGEYAAWLVRVREAVARGEELPADPPASIRGRDVLRELGTAGQSMDAPETAVVPAREAIARARSDAAAARAAERDARAAQVAARAAARDADRVAREQATTSEGDAA